MEAPPKEGCVIDCHLVYLGMADRPIGHPPYGIDEKLLCRIIDVTGCREGRIFLP